MKRIFVLCALLCSTLYHSTFAAEVAPIANGYHIVVATYSDRQEKEARVYSESLNKRGLSSGYGLEKGKNFIYVFLQTFDFDHFSDAVKAMTEVRKKPEFATAWVVKIKDGREIKEGDPVEDVVVKETIPAPKEPIIVTEYIENPPMKPITRPQHLGNTPVFMSVFRDRDGKLVDADIKVIDPEKSKQLTVVKGNRYLNLPDPRTKSGRLSLVASAFGYKDMQLDIGYYT